jgi:hypothetical protein
MRGLVVLAVGLCLALPALAEIRDEVHPVGDGVVKITVAGTLEVLTVGPSEEEQGQVLSGADVEIVAFAADADCVALLGQLVVVVEVTGTHSCEAGDARAYSVVTLGAVPAAEGPVTTCAELLPSVIPGGVMLEADPMGVGEAWLWVPGKGWKGQ